MQGGVVQGIGWASLPSVATPACSVG
jgi:hypothetical protein